MIKQVRIVNGFDENMLLKLQEPIIRDNGEEAVKEDGIFITGIDGLGPVKADIRMNESATSHGSKFNSARANSRDITFHFRFLDINGLTVEDSRLVIYHFFPLTEKVIIYIWTENRYVKTEGYVEAIEPEIFAKEPDVFGASVTVKCPSAWFIYAGMGKTDKHPFSNLYDAFEFEMEDNPTPSLIFTEIAPGKEHVIDYPGDVETGMIISIKSNDNSLFGSAQYVEIASAGRDVNPKSEGWFEKINNKYTLTEDTTYNSSKIYYEKQIKWRMPTIYNNITREKMAINTNMIEYDVDPNTPVIPDPGWDPVIEACTIGGDDEIRISTVTGNKYIKFIRDGKEFNVLNALPLDTDWLTLHPGRNVFSYECGKFADETKDNGQYAIRITMTANVYLAGV